MSMGTPPVTLSLNSTSSTGSPFTQLHFSKYTQTKQLGKHSLDRPDLDGFDCFPLLLVVKHCNHLAVIQPAGIIEVLISEMHGLHLSSTSCMLAAGLVLSYTASALAAIPRAGNNLLQALANNANLLLFQLLKPPWTPGYLSMQVEYP